MVTIKIIETADEMVGGSYSYRMPNIYFPRYRIVKDRKLMAVDDYNPNDYTFSAKVDLIAPTGKKINFMSTPSFANYMETVNDS